MSRPHHWQLRQLVRLGAAATGLLGLTLAIATAPAAPASAKPIEGWGFAYSGNYSPAPGSLLPTDRQWGSWKTAFPAEWATITRMSTGMYQVRFPHLAGEGITHVTAIHGGPISCQVAGSAPIGADQAVKVSCFAPHGTPADSPFAVLFSSKLGIGGPGAYAYLVAKATGGVTTSYNSAGAANSVSHGGPGQYKADLPGLGNTSPAGNIQVTAIGWRAARCKVTSWLPVMDRQIIYVSCYDANGQLTDSDFALTYHHKVSVFGEAAPPKLFGYIWDTLGALPPAANVNSQGGLNTATSAGGYRQYAFPRVGASPSHVQVTAYGQGPAFCNLSTPHAVSGDTATVRAMACYDPAGYRISEQAFASYTAAF